MVKIIMQESQTSSSLVSFSRLYSRLMCFNQEIEYFTRVLSEIVGILKGGCDVEQKLAVTFSKIVV
jgi:hypothetical protein